MPRVRRCAFIISFNLLLEPGDCCSILQVKKQVLPVPDRGTDKVGRVGAWNQGLRIPGDPPEGVYQKRGVSDGPEEREKGNMAGRVHVEMGRCESRKGVLLAGQPLSVQFSSVAQLCWPCDPMNCSMPGLPVHHQLAEPTQTHLHWVGDTIQLSHPLSSPSPPVFSLSQHQGLFKWVSSSHQVAKVLEFQLQHQSFQ